MQTEKPLKQFHLHLKTELDSLTKVLRWFEKIATPLFPEQFCEQCKVALAEGFTNAVRHAHQDLPPTTPIELEVNLFAHCLEIRIWDQGQPFNFAAELQSRLQRDRDPLREEGRGLIFMQQLTDELCYIRMPDQRNCLVMRKRIRD